MLSSGEVIRGGDALGTASGNRRLFGIWGVRVGWVWWWLGGEM